MMEFSLPLLLNKRRFLKKILHIFRNFEGKVVLTFYVWSIDEPSYILHNKLVTDYGRDMDNIRIGSVYEDSGTVAVLYWQQWNR